MPAPTLQIILTTQQRNEFTVCARACGLDLEAWIVQCAAVQAAAVIDAMQAPLRGQRQLPEKTPLPSRTAKRATFETARAYNERFRVRPKDP